MKTKEIVREEIEKPGIRGKSKQAIRKFAYGCQIMFMGAVVLLFGYMFECASVIRPFGYLLLLAGLITTAWARADFIKTAKEASGRIADRIHPDRRE